MAEPLEPRKLVNILMGLVTYVVHNSDSDKIDQAIWDAASNINDLAAKRSSGPAGLSCTYITKERTTNHDPKMR